MSFSCIFLKLVLSERFISYNVYKFNEIIFAPPPTLPRSSPPSLMTQLCGCFFFSFNPSRPICATQTSLEVVFHWSPLIRGHTPKILSLSQQLTIAFGSIFPGLASAHTGFVHAVETAVDSYLQCPDASRR